MKENTRNWKAMAMLCLLTASVLSIVPGAVTGDTEPNDDFATAEFLPSEQAVKGNVTVQVDMVDYYYINVSSGSHWMLNCTATAGDNVTFTFYDNDRNVLDTSGLLVPVDSWFREGLTGGMELVRYYLKVELEAANWSYNYSNYTLYLMVDPQTDSGASGDASDDIGNATELPTGRDGHYGGMVGDNDPSDFYYTSGNVLDDIQIVFGVESGYGEGYLAVYDKDHNPERTSEGAEAGEQVFVYWALSYTGVYFIEVYSGADHDGSVISYYFNISSTPGNDTVAPGVNITYPVTGATLDSATIQVTGTAWDNVEVALVEVSVNNGAWVTASGTTDWSGDVVLYAGDNHIVARATDTSGNTGSEYVNVTLSATNDTEPPWIDISFPEHGTVFYDATIPVDGNASDNVAVAKVELSVNHGPWVLATGTEAWSGEVTISPGSNNIAARAVDTSGNSAVDNVTVYLIAVGNDTTPPMVYIYDPVNWSVLDTLTYTVKWNASDDVAVLKVDVRIDDGAWNVATPADPDWTTGTYDATFPGPGNHSVTARATDTAGNEGFHQIYVIVNVSGPANDTTKPNITITSPAFGAVLDSANIQVCGTAHDDVAVAKVEVNVNSGAWVTATGTTSWTAAVTLTAGDNRIEARATDTSGNTGTVYVNVTLNQTGPANDTQNPVINITTPRNGSTTTSSKIRIAGTASDNVGLEKVELTVNGVAVPVSGMENWEAKNVSLRVGTNTIVATATDTSGNTASVTVKVKREETPPPFIPGFEALFLVAAVVVGVAILARRRK